MEAPIDSFKKITLEDIWQAKQVVAGIVETTPVRQSLALSSLLGSDVFLKYENEQLTGSFKIRGAMNKMVSLTSEERARGVVCSSAGNHAQGVAYSAMKNDVKAHVVMPVTSPMVKITATRSYGAEVILHGDFYDEAYQHALKLEREQNYLFVHPYQDPKIIAGQGTLGLELLEQLPALDSVIVPIGGGGLISGIATAIKSLKPSCKVYGVVSDQVPGMRRMFKKEAVPPRERRIATIADGIAVKNTSQVMYETYISNLIDDIVEVTDDELALAIVFMLEKAKTVVEGSGAAGVAAMMSGKIKPGKKSCIVLSGGNIDLNIISKVIERGQRQNGRLARIAVVVDDMPGNLNRLTTVMASERANILEVYHDRVSPELNLRETRIDFLVETFSDEHIAEILEALRGLGCRIVDSPKGKN